MTIADTFYYCKQYSKAISIYKRKLSLEQESRHLLFYIHSLYESREDGKTLLSLLELWRIHYSFNENLLRMEAELCNFSMDYGKCLDICNYFLRKFENDEAILTLKLITLNHFKESNNQEFIAIAKHLSKTKFRISKNVATVAKVLFDNQLYNEGFEILNNHWELKELRGLYFFSYLEYGEKSKIFEYPKTVEWGHFVRCEIDGKEQIIEMDSENSTQIQKELYGKKVGDIVSLNRPMSGKEDAIQIKKIMTKEIYRLENLYQEAKNPYSGLPMESFEFKSNQPEDMIKQIESIAGISPEKITQRDLLLSDYYESKLSFTEITFNLFDSDYFQAYYDLVLEKGGIRIPPLNIYFKYNINENTKYMLDFTTLFIFYQISTIHKITFPNKFIIPKYIFELVNRRLGSLKSSSHYHKVTPIPGDITTTKFSENPIKCQIEYFEGLIDWIGKKCEIQTSPRIVDFRNQEENINSRLFVEYISHIILLLEDNVDYTLITDDLIFLKFRMLPIEKQISSEKYVKSFFCKNHNSLIEFLNNKYDGYSFTNEQFLIELQNKNANIPNKYDFIVNKGNYYDFETLMDNIIGISKINELSEEKRIEKIEYILDVMIKTINNPELVSNFTALLYIKSFSVPETSKNIIIECLRNQNVN